ncbi:hypothetical protein GJ496_009265 [Pomphorhynchus laevis]|nr:hypothetical protein GJ496_009265 [Pomphorhynchus laevis]
MHFNSYQNLTRDEALEICSRMVALAKSPEFTMSIGSVLSSNMQNPIKNAQAMAPILVDLQKRVLGDAYPEEPDAFNQRLNQIAQGDHDFERLYREIAEHFFIDITGQAFDKTKHFEFNKTM